MKAVSKPSRAEGSEDNVVSVVCVDDDTVIVKTIASYLADTECRVTTFTDPEKCLAVLRETPADIVITDLRMPRIDGLTVLAEVKRIHPSTDVIILTGDADKTSAIEALKLGAFDLLEKPLNKDEILETVKRTVRYRTVLRERNEFEQQVSFLSSREAKRWGIDAFIGKSRAIKKAIEDIRALQKADKTSVLVMGESGTGKELVARAIHSGSSRSTRPFVPVNCSAIPDNLAESLLFGHTRGAFTGAATDKKGAFDNAHGGTLFLDEIGDMLPSIQAKLLRVLEDATVCPVGAANGHKVDVRIIAATNANLKAKLAAGTFRSDLYHRLAAFTISLMPLREHKDDIPLLAEHFAQMLSSEMGLPSPQLSPEAVRVLESHNFPGNARELKNTIERALIKSSGREIEPKHITLETASSPSVVGSSSTSQLPTNTPLNSDMPLNLREMEELTIKRAMEQTGGNVSAAAHLLGVGRSMLYRRLPKI